MLWCSLEAPHQGASNEYPQHMFSWRNKKICTGYPPLSGPMDIFGLKKILSRVNATWECQLWIRCINVWKFPLNGAGPNPWSSACRPWALTTRPLVETGNRAAGWSSVKCTCKSRCRWLNPAWSWVSFHLSYLPHTQQGFSQRELYQCTVCIKTPWKECL